jgi:hypothetical protein
MKLVISCSNIWKSYLICMINFFSIRVLFIETFVHCFSCFMHQTTTFGDLYRTVQHIVHVATINISFNINPTKKNIQFLSNIILISCFLLLTHHYLQYECFYLILEVKENFSNPNADLNYFYWEIKFFLAIF